MSGNSTLSPAPGSLPSWVPEAARRYIAHTEDGLSIRALARTGKCHASTVLRQIRRVENLRDDQLVDEALRGLGRFRTRHRGGVDHEEPETMTMHQPIEDDTVPDATTLRREACRILRRLCDPGAVMAVAPDMDKAVVVRDTGDGTTVRLAVLDRAVARAMALKDWIACDQPGRVSRYRITAAGRTELNRLLAEAGNFALTEAPGLSEGRAHFDHAAPADAGDTAEAAPRRIRYGAVDSPVAMLARRRDRDGQPFLEPDLVRAGARLSEDFELAQMGPRTTQNWDRFLTAGVQVPAPGGVVAQGPEAAKLRVAGALRELGPGLGDVALRCCCYQQGLETAERRMGWSARSGKIVLRIALQRLKRHYDSLGDAGGLIG